MNFRSTPKPSVPHSETKWPATLKVFFEARNLNDAEAREHASFLKDYAPLPGRSFRVGAGYRF
mgnify:CR=1 FL=1